MPLEAPPGRLEAQGSALADTVYALLARAIVDGRLVPGERVRDVEIAELYGISRTPVREAIQRLERQGMVEVSAHRYTRVTTPDESSRDEALEYIGQLAGMALRMAVRRADDEVLAALIADLDEIIGAATSGDVATLTTMYVSFHRRASLAAGNRMLLSTLREIYLPVSWLVGPWTPYGSDPAARKDSFIRLRDAVAARDELEAERIVREQHPLV